jgi:hypothetical protein
MNELLAIPEELEDEPWFIEPKDRNPAPELDRQKTFLAMLARLGPACDAVAIPNAGKSTDWERVQRWKEGARAGALDLVGTWAPTRPDDRGVFFPEFKDGKKMPTPAQRDRLNRYFRMGHRCGVYRKPETLIEHLRAAGAPIRSARS